MNLKSLCRTCLRSGELMFPLFDDIEKAGFYGTPVKILETFTFVPIHNKAHLPDHICANCLNNIQQAYSFTLKCEQSEMILNQLKEVKVNLKKVKKIPNRHEFNSESNCILSAVKEEPEVLNVYDYGDYTTNDNVIKSEFELTQMSLDNQFVRVKHEADNQVSFKNEPELHIEDICGGNEFKANKELKCPACEKHFKSFEVFRRHTVTNHIDGSLCKLCNEEFDCSQFEHSIKHLPINYYLDEITHVGEDLKKPTGNLEINEKYCQHCSQHFTDVEMFNLHVCSKILSNQFHHDNDIKMECKEQKAHQRLAETKDTNKLTDPKSKHICNICSKGFGYKYGLTKHMRIHTGETPYKCKFCPEQFRSAPPLRIHMEINHLNELPNGKPRYQCPICFKILSSSRHEIEHKRIHTGEYPFECEWCLRKFRYKTSMVSHSLVMHAEELANEKPKYQCTVCSESFRYKSDLDPHMRGHEKEKQSAQFDPSKYQCNICSKMFNNSQSVSKHKRVHTVPTVAKRQCQICYQNFRHSRMLAIHMETKHINELPEANARNQCRVCSKLLSNKHSLAVHMRSHTGENPYQCELCSISFQYKHLLRVHMEMKHLHELPGDQKPKYQCNVCSKILGFNRTLISHMRIHTGEKPFECEVCNEKFRFHGQLYKHMLNHHYEEMMGNETNYTCSICSKMYAYKMMLDIHMKAKHGKKLTE